MDLVPLLFPFFENWNLDPKLLTYFPSMLFPKIRNSVKIFSTGNLVVVDQES
jgi:hypothetical protein